LVIRTGKPGSQGTNDGSSPKARNTTRSPAAAPSIRTVAATRSPTAWRTSVPATRSPSSTPRSYVAATLAPFVTAPITTFRSYPLVQEQRELHHRQGQAHRDRSHQRALDHPRPAFGTPGKRGTGHDLAAEADVGKEPGDQVPERVAGHAPDQHHERCGELGCEPCSEPPTGSPRWRRAQGCR